MSTGNILSNMTVLQKADLALADISAGGGLLLPEPAQQFIRLLIDESRLLPMATVVPMKAQNAFVPKIRFASRILRPGQEATALSAADRSKPTLTNVELHTKLFKAEVRLPDEVLEDNIEKDQLKATIMSMMSEAIARDIEEVAILGDTALGDGSTLAQLDGVLKLSTSNVVDAAGATLNKGILKDMLKAMPKVYMRDRTRMRFLTSIDAKIDLTDNLGNRQTAGGDTLTFDGGTVKYQGVTLDEVPMFPDNLGGGNNTTDVLLTDPKNLQVGIWRQIKMETAKDISAGVTIIVATLRIGIQWAEEAAVVKAINVKVAA